MSNYKLHPLAKPNAGWVRQKHGDEAEQVIDQMINGEYGCAWNKLGVLRKRHTQLIVKDGQRIYKGAAGVDFTGYLRGGRACLLEVKYTKGPHLDLAILTSEQIDELNDAMEAGCCCVLVVLRGEAPKHPTTTIHPVPWALVRMAIENGIEKLESSALDAWKLPPNCLLLNYKAFSEQVQPWRK